MLRIAVASEKEQVTAHFGHCEAFIVFDTENDEIIGMQSLPNPGHKPGFLPKYLNEKGVDVIISGGMGQSAVDIFNDNDIEVIVGAAGTARESAEKYLKGELKCTGSICHDHDHG